MSMTSQREKANPKTRCLVIAGPTASGKSALALALAQAKDGVVINADSMQLYREIPVVTAQPDATELSKAPHQLYGILSAQEENNVTTWLNLAKKAIEDTTKHGKQPIIVGGTGMYLQALIAGLSPVPHVNPAIREEAKATRAKIGAAAFHAAFAEKDPVMAARLNPTDTTRVLRAWEVIVSTGTSLADFQAMPRIPPTDLSFITLTLLPPRDWLYDRINHRFAHMTEKGAIDEVKTLLALNLPEDCPPMKAVGVPEIRRFLSGEQTLDQAIEKASQATRRYAKRQFTWLRGQMQPAKLGHALIDSYTVNTQLSKRLMAEIINNIT